MTCFSTCKSTTPGTADMALRTSSARLLNTPRSSPKILTATCALTPDRMWSIRWEIGWPILTTIPGIVASFARMSSSTSFFPRPLSLNSTSISEACTPSAWSSSSARPVRRPVRATSGTCIIRFSAMAPIRLLSASEVPGTERRLIVALPSLKGGRNSLPKVMVSNMAAAKAANVTNRTSQRSFNTTARPTL